MSVINNPHDKFFRAAMSRKQVAKSFFKSHLPADILQKMNLETLALVKGSFIDVQLKERMSDILYSVSWNKKKGYLYLLVEHQSRPEKLMPLRIWRYILRIIDAHLKQYPSQQLPVIYPLVFYHGKAKYEYSTDFFELFGDDKEWVKSIYLQPFQLIDITSIPDEKLKQRYWNGIMELVLKRAYEQDIMPYIHDIIELVVELDKQGEADYIESIIYYVSHATEISNKDYFFEELNKNLSSNTGETIMTIAEQLREEGRKMGISQGIDQGISQGFSQGIDQGIRQGISQGVSQGIAKGEEKALLSVAAQMLAEGLDVALIKRLTGLAENKILLLVEIAS